MMTIDQEDIVRSEVIRVVIVCTYKEHKRDNRMIIQYDDNGSIYH